MAKQRRNFHEEVTQKEVRQMARKLGRLLRKGPYGKQYNGYLLVFCIDKNHYQLMGCNEDPPARYKVL